MASFNQYSTVGGSTGKQKNGDRRYSHSSRSPAKASGASSAHGQPRPQHSPTQYNPSHSGYGQSQDEVDGHEEQQQIPGTGASHTATAPGERTWQRHGNFSMMPPIESRRQKAQEMARSEEESYQKYRAQKLESQGSFSPVSRTLAASSQSSPPNISAVRAEQQQKARAESLTKPTRDRAKREHFRQEARRKENEEIQRHKEKQRLKAQELKLREQQRQLACRSSTRQHWENQFVLTAPSQEEPAPATPSRSVFPSQHAKHRQYMADKRAAEEAQYEQHKKSQRDKADYQAARATEEAHRVQEEVRRAWADRTVQPSTGPSTHRDHQVHGSHVLAVADNLMSSTLLNYEWEEEEAMTSQPKLKSAMTSPAGFQSSYDSGDRDQLTESTMSSPSHSSLNWPSNARPQDTSTAMKTTHNVQYLTECQANLCALGLKKLSLTEINALLTANNGNIDMVANLMLAN